MSLSREQFRHLIPHGGTMCLIDRILAWNETVIRCGSFSHRLPDHPLSEQGNLHAICGVEYAAQAAALHGGLLAQQTGNRAAPGFLAGLRRVRFSRQRLNDLEEELMIVADCQWADAGGLLYDFTVDAGPERILSGRLSIILPRESSR